MKSVDENDNAWIDVDLIRSCVEIIRHVVKPGDEILSHVIEIEKMLKDGKITGNTIETDPHFDAICKWMDERTFR